MTTFAKNTWIEQMPSDENELSADGIQELLDDAVTHRDEQIEKLQEDLAEERDARREERFLFIFVCIIIFDIAFFTVMPSFGGPIALMILELLVLVPLARRMGMEEIATLFDRVLSRMVKKAGDGE